MAKRNIVILTSGGLGSTVATCRSGPDEQVHCVFADYGQPAAAREFAAVQAVAKSNHGTIPRRLTISHVTEINAFSGRGGVGAASGAGSGLRLTDISQAPLLPTLVLAAAQWAVRIGAGQLVLGLYRGPNFSQVERARNPQWVNAPGEFIHAANILLETALPAAAALEVTAPLIDLAAGEVIRLGQRLQTPLNLTWSCEQAGESPCRACHGCLRREQAFQAAGIEEPSLALAR